jgi:hypothetical protein
MKKISLLLAVCSVAFVMNAAETTFSLPVVLDYGVIRDCDAYVDGNALHILNIFGAQQEVVYTLGADGSMTGYCGDLKVDGLQDNGTEINTIYLSGDDCLSYNQTTNKVTDRVFFYETECVYDFYFVWPKYTDYSKAGKTFEYGGISYQVTTENTCATMHGFKDPKDNSIVAGYNTSLTGDVEIPETAYDEAGNVYTVTAIGEWSFYGCGGMTSVKVPDTVVSINYSAFGRCDELVKASIPELLTDLGGGVFFNDAKLTTVSLPKTLTTINKKVLCGCSSLKSIEIPETVTSICANAFQNCSSLTGELVIPESVTDIEAYAFWGTGYTGLKLPSRLNTIGYAAFAYCTEIAGEVEIPNTLITIPDFLFFDCEKIESIKLPNSIKEIGGGAFKMCYALTGELVIPNSVTMIADDFISYCTSLKSMRFEDGDDELLMPLDMYDTVVLENLYIGRNINSADFGALSDLKKVEFGEKVTSITEKAFRNCISVLTVVSRSVTPPATSNAFSENTVSNGRLYVPKSAVADYHAAECWEKFCIVETLEKYDGVALTAADSEQVKVYAESGAICLEGNALMTITTMSGAILYSGVGSARVNVLPGIYLVTTPDGTTKLTVR